MKNGISKLRKMTPLALYCSLMTMMVSALPAAAADTSYSTMSGLSTVQGAIDDIQHLATGPVARLIAIIAVIGGAIAFSQGREMNEGMKNLGLVAIVIGLLIGVTNLVNSLGAGI